MLKRRGKTTSNIQSLLQSATRHYCHGALAFIAPTPDYEAQTSYTATINVKDGLDTVTREVIFGIENDPDDDLVLAVDQDRSVMAGL